MKQKLIAILLILCLLMSLSPAVFAEEATLENSIDLDSLEANCRQLYLRFEGGYDTVVPKDSNALSIGFVQWHGNNALTLMRMICSAAPSTAENTLGTALYNEIVNSGTSWATRTLSSAEAAKIKAAIGSQVGRQCQDRYAHDYIMPQIRNGWNYGVRTPAGLVYYCALENKYGSGGAKSKMRTARSCLGFSDSDVFDSLDALHNAIITYTSVDPQNRQRIYDFIVQNLGLDPGPIVSEPEDPWSFFTDLPPKDHWSYEAIIYALEHGIFGGITATSFGPNKTMTRAMLVTVLYSIEGRPKTEYDLHFTDATSGYYIPALRWAMKNGLVAGVSETRFAPKSPITRQMLAVILYRYAEYKGTLGTVPADANLSAFSDADKVSAYARTAMIWATSQKLMTGSNGRLMPRKEATRAEVALILMRFLTR